MAICLLPQKVEDFKRALKQKEINIVDLLNMTTEARTKLLEKYAGENAKDVNTLFEKKLILKNKVLGIKNWASKLGEIGRYDPQKKAKLEELANEFEKKQQERILNPKETDAFLSDLAEETLGTKVSREEAATIFEMTDKADTILEKGFNKDTLEWRTPEDKAEYGASKLVLEQYLSKLSDETISIKDALESRGYQFKQQFKENKIKAVSDLLLDVVKQVTDNSVSLVATLDNSFLGRQGLNTLKTHPSIWWEEMVKKSFSDFARTIGGEKTLDALWADIYSNPLYINGELQKAKILPKSEEQFPSSIPERIPALGRIFKASESAFSGSALRGRIKLYELIRGIAENNGVEIDNKQIESIGTLVNSLTARGKWGKRGEPSVVKLVLWAPKMLKAHLDNLILHPSGLSDITPFARKQAQINLVKIISSTAIVLGIANALQPGSAELDPRSSKSGKIVIGTGKKAQTIGVLLDLIGLSSTTYSDGSVALDTTGGAASIITLASRLATMSSKSSTTGIVNELGSGYGKTSGFDLAVDFLTNKTTPIAHAIIDVLRGEKFGGDKPTVANTFYGLTTPISVQNFINLLDDRIPGTDWGQSEAKEIVAFKEKVGEDKFKQANNEFNTRFNSWMADTKKRDVYKNLSEEDKQKVVTDKKAKIKEQIFKEYGFVYKKTKSKVLPKL